MFCSSVGCGRRVFFRPIGADSINDRSYPRLTPWAAFFRRSAAVLGIRAKENGGTCLVCVIRVGEPERMRIQIEDLPACFKSRCGS